jgi:hypothetical protein
MSRKRFASRVAAASAFTFLAACGATHTAAPPVSTSTTPPVSSGSSQTSKHATVPVEVPLKVAGGFGTIVGHIEACARKPPGRTVAGIVIVTHGVKAINHTTGQAIIEARRSIDAARRSR